MVHYLSLMHIHVNLIETSGLAGLVCTASYYGASPLIPLEELSRARITGNNN